jgi:hypothetical protein
MNKKELLKTIKFYKKYLKELYHSKNTDFTFNYYKSTYIMLAKNAIKQSKYILNNYEV